MRQREQCDIYDVEKKRYETRIVGDTYPIRMQCRVDNISQEISGSELWLQYREVQDESTKDVIIYGIPGEKVGEAVFYPTDRYALSGGFAYMPFRVAGNHQYRIYEKEDVYSKNSMHGELVYIDRAYRSYNPSTDANLQRYSMTEQITTYSSGWMQIQDPFDGAEPWWIKPVKEETEEAGSD